MATPSILEFLRKRMQPAQMLVQYMHLLHDPEMQLIIAEGLDEFQTLLVSDLTIEDSEQLVTAYFQLAPFLPEIASKPDFWVIIPEVLRPRFINFFNRLLSIQPELELHIERLEWQRLSVAQFENVFEENEPVYTTNDLIYQNPSYKL